MKSEWEIDREVRLRVRKIYKHTLIGLGELALLAVLVCGFFIPPGAALNCQVAGCGTRAVLVIIVGSMAWVLFGLWLLADGLVRLTAHRALNDVV